MFQPTRFSRAVQHMKATWLLLRYVQSMFKCKHEKIWVDNAAMASKTKKHNWTTITDITDLKMFVHISSKHSFKFITYCYEWKTQVSAKQTMNFHKRLTANICSVETDWFYTACTFLYNGLQVNTFNLTGTGESTTSAYDSYKMRNVSSCRCCTAQ